MLTYSLLARVTGPPAKASAWAHEVAELVTRKTGVTVNVSARLGGHQEIIWVSQYDDFPAFQKSQAAIGADADYGAMIQAAADANLFDAASIDTAFWLPI